MDDSTQHDPGPPSRRRHLCTRALLAVLAVALAGCATGLPADPIARRNALLGIQPGTVPAHAMRPDGLMINGLLPPQWGNSL